MPNFSGVWTLSQQFQGRGQGLWPALPSAPTIGTATAGLALCATVTFTAPTCVGAPPPLTYTVTSTPGGVTTTGSASPLIVTGLTGLTSYTFRVKANNSAGTGPCSAASNSVTAKLASCVAFETVGTFSWVVPSGVTSIAGVTVGAGGGGGGCQSGGGGALSYKNSIAVTPGETLTVTVGTGGLGRQYYTGCRTGTPSTIYRSGTLLVGANGGAGISGGTRLSPTDGGGNGGGGNSAFYAVGGGGAGGYSGAGGAGGGSGGSGSAGAGGGAGGAPAGRVTLVSSYPGTSYWWGGGGGGGVGIYGQGTSGAATAYSGSSSLGGSGGSGGTIGVSGYCGGGGNGGVGGGGGSASYRACYDICGNETGYTLGYGATGGRGAVRIVWNGCGRGVPSFPSTNVGPS